MPSKSIMKYSVIILNYNVKYFVDACLQTVQKAVEGHAVEIIVADNNSTDGSRSYLPDKYPEVTFLWFNENLGFAKAYNRAVKTAKGKFILILNPDTLVSENLFEVLDHFISGHPDFGIIGGQMIDGTGRFLPESKRQIPRPMSIFSKLTGLDRIFSFPPFNSYYATAVSPDETGKVAVLTGAFMCLPKKVYEKVGGFDERYFMYGEDIDLSYKVLKIGLNNYYLHSLKIIHFKGESAGKTDQYYQNFFNSTIQFYRKHFKSNKLVEFLGQKLLKIWLWIRRIKKTSPTNLPTIKKTYFLGSKKHLKHIYPHFPFVQLISDKPASFDEPSRLIFDMTYLPVSQIIDTMRQLKEQPVSFRFFFPARQMILGSDSKDHLGEVLLPDK